LLLLLRFLGLNAEPNVLKMLPPLLLPARLGVPVTMVPGLRWLSDSVSVTSLAG
jgi:hypothetical protein